MSTTTTPVTPGASDQSHAHRHAAHQSASDPAPHLGSNARVVRAGGFFLAGDLQQSDADAGAWQLGPAWVQWEAPAEGTTRTPWVLVHGGGGQSTDWLGIDEDGGSGWAPRLVGAGFPTYLLDRPGHGRSPYDPGRLGGRTGFPDYSGAVAVFASGTSSCAGPGSDHSAWPWGRLPGSPQLDRLVASSSGMLTDTRLGQELDARRIVDLLERTGPSVLATHSAGAAGGWLAASRSPHRVKAIVTFEPLGPPFRDLGLRGRLEHGLTAVPLNGQQSLNGLPVLVVSGAASGRAGADAETVDFLNHSGAKATHLRLEDRKIYGNGHGLIFENNINEILEPVLNWLAGNNIT